MTNTTIDPTPAAVKKKSRKWPWILLAAAVIGIGINAVSGGSTPDAPATHVNAVTGNAVSGIGFNEPGRDGKFEFTVTNVALPVPRIGSTDFGVAAQGRFVKVTVKVTNIGDEPQTFFGSNTKGTDTKGHTVEPSTEAAIYLPDSNSLLTPINPGNSVTGTIVFDLPVGAHLSSLELHDSAFSGGVTVTL